MGYKAAYCSNCGAQVFLNGKEEIDLIKKLLEKKSVQVSIEKKAGFRPILRQHSRKKYGGGLSSTQEVYIFNHQYSKLWKDFVVDAFNEYEDLNEKTIVCNTFELNPLFRKKMEGEDRLVLLNADDFCANGFGGGYSLDENKKIPCPICKRDLIVDKVSFDSGYDNSSWEMSDLSLRYIQGLEEDECKRNVKDFLVKTEGEFNYATQKVAADSEIVKMYLDNLINIESDIRFFSGILENLLLKYRVINRAVNRERLILPAIEKESTQNRIRDLEQRKKDIGLKYKPLDLNVLPSDLHIEEPQKPILKKAGLFNKKKIEAENNSLIETYNKAIEMYKIHLAELKEHEIENRKKENENIRKRKNEEIGQIDEEITKLKSNPEHDNNPIRTDYSFCLTEIEEVQSKIRELCDAKSKMLSYGIIYAKYVDFMAITTMFEYFMSGRVTSLEGPDGAYNLYESEVRADRIIAQLDNVIDSLDSIKDTQYRAYMELSEINKNTEAISEKMSTAVKSLEHISKNTDSIKETSELIAYNTAKTAYYSKVNAELTNALGFMMALK